MDFLQKKATICGKSDDIENIFVTSHIDLEEYINRFGFVVTSMDYYIPRAEETKKEDYDILNTFDEHFFNDHNLAIEAHDASTSTSVYRINDITKNESEVDINITHTTYSYGGVFAQSIMFTFIILDKDVTNANFIVETRHIDNDEDRGIAFKPIIYLYPTTPTEVCVSLQYKNKITTSYPKYNDGWNVLAKTDGTLIDLKTNKSLYSLYYESENELDFKVQNDGFIVKGEEAATFLEEKLAVLGLSEREAEEFIIYWLPKLEANKYNYIRFASINEINANMPIEINPNPDTTIRVLMTFKGLDNPIEVTEQNLQTPERKGFVAVEWGGTEIK